MSNVNPNNPVILGIEWVPLTEQFRPLDINTEYGYGFTVTGAPNNAPAASDVLYNPPASQIAGQTIFSTIYPRGREDDTGEIQVIRIPAGNVALTGATAVGSGPLVLSGDDNHVLFSAASNRIRINFEFAPANITNALTGRRILAVDFVYQAAGTPGFALEPTLENFNFVYPYGPGITGPSTLKQVANLGTVRFGEVNPWWNLASGATPATDIKRFPFRLTELSFLNAASGTPLFVGVRVSNLPASGSAMLGFAALDIYYCEESRVLYGGAALGEDTASGIAFQSPTGESLIELRTPSFVVGATLTPADYTITSQLADAGDKYNAGDKIALASLFQLSPVRTHPTIQTMKFQRPVGNKPAVAPLTTSSDFMHAVSMTLVDGVTALQNGEAPFTYADLNAAPVYLTVAGTSITAVQEIHNEAAAANQTYEQVRFYARRFNPLAAGDLTVSVAGSGSATITPAQFNALPELNIGPNGVGTGWREVTLPITATFTSDGTFRNVTFAMTGVAASQPIDQWQILISRTFISTVATANTSWAKSRYDGHQNANLTWKSPVTSGDTTSVDGGSTAIVMFSQDSAAPTGLAVIQQSQAVTGIGLDCGATPTCIPTGILYNHITWGPGAVVCDAFNRVVAAGSWGVADTGQTWNVNIAGDFSVNGSRGLINMSTVNAIRRASIDGPVADGYAVALVKPTVVALGAPIDMAVTLRRDSGANNDYRAEIQFGLTGAATLRVRRNLGGVLTTIQTFTLPSYTASSEFYIAFQVVGTLLQARAWPVGTTEPSFWQISVIDTNITAAGASGVTFILETGNTNTLPVILETDNFFSAPIDLVGASYELQRLDTVDNVWQTISSQSVCVVMMNDYEARVGIQSSYRIRTCNIGGFCGPWSSTVNFTLAAPGITGADDGNSVLIFTSNQAPLASLAYIMNFEGPPIEDFGFAEAGFVQLRTQYQRDFFTAFHGTERGGEQFSRLVLTQAGAIAPEALADFKELRDLAWASLPYVCVRDELGDRWFANVRVPGGNVRNNRRLYLANIGVTETTNTPAPVTT